jgi:hypothetical protein
MTTSQSSSAKNLCYDLQTVSFRFSVHMDGRRWFHWLI